MSLTVARRNPFYDLYFLRDYAHYPNASKLCECRKNMISSFERSPQRYARSVGVIYLAIIVLGIFGELLVRETLVVSGDALATANNISASPLLWRAGIVGDLLMQALDVPMMVIFYLLLRPVSEGLALFGDKKNRIVAKAFFPASAMVVSIGLPS